MRAWLSQRQRMKFEYALAQVLLEEREKAGLTQARLAELSGLSSRAIQKYESGEAEPLLGSVFNLCKGLNVSEEQFFKRINQLLESSQH